VRRRINKNGLLGIERKNQNGARVHNS
jgi:hypothetical protein